MGSEQEWQQKLVERFLQVAERKVEKFFLLSFVFF